MLIRGVVRDEIEDQLQSGAMGRLQEMVEIIQRTEHGVYGAIVRNVVTKIRHWGWEDWR
jgi:hypothetical protein